MHRNMRVYISVDIEGITGLVSWAQAGRPSSDHYDWEYSRRMMTHDVVAAIEGAKAGGATQFLVKDSHNTGKNLLLDQLPDGVKLISGAGAGDNGMMEGINFIGATTAFLIGYHAMAGTPQAVMEHTINGRVHRFKVNGVEWGEIAMSMATATQYQVPTSLVTSDEAGCREALTFNPGIKAVPTKSAIGRYMADLYSPAQTEHEIFVAARDAVVNGGAHVALPAVFELSLEMNCTHEADAIWQLKGWTRQDGYTNTYTAADWPEAHTAVRRAMAAALQANGD